MYSYWGSMLKNIKPVLFISLLLSLEVASQELIGSVFIPAKVRDFNESILDSNSHPDFETFMGQGCKNAVLPIIGESGQSSQYYNDHKNPIFNPDVECNPKQFSGPEYFNQWYDDYAPDINRSFLIYLQFDIYDDCKIRYENTLFTPIDDGKLFAPMNSPALETFGHLHPTYKDHNWGFTLELHTTFTYIRGANQTFNFRGDDDVWVFINDSLLVDLGGLHEAQVASVNLDDLRPGFLIDGNEYDFDFFFAERHSYGSNLIIESGLLLGLDFTGILGAALDFDNLRLKRYTYMECYGEVLEIPEGDNPLLTPILVPVDNKAYQKINMKIKKNMLIVNTGNTKIIAPESELYIYGINGKLIKQLKIRNRGQANTVFELPQISSGCYVMCFKNGMTTYSSRMLLKPDL